MVIFLRFRVSWCYLPFIEITVHEISVSGQRRSCRWRHAATLYVQCIELFCWFERSVSFALYISLLRAFKSAFAYRRPPSFYAPRLFDRRVASFFLVALFRIINRHGSRSRNIKMSLRRRWYPTFYYYSLSSIEIETPRAQIFRLSKR